MDKLKVGFIGLGGISAAHIRECRELSGSVVMQAATEVREDQLKNICDANDIPARYKDYKKMLDESALDAVFINTPPVGRYEMIKDCLEHRVAVLCEKPMATTLEEGDRILEICEKYRDTPVLLNFKMRQGHNFQKIKKYLEDPEVGRPITIGARYALVTDPAIWAPPKWFWDLKISGGLLVENAGHMIDYILWIAGPVKRLFAHTEQKTIPCLKEDYMRKSGTEDHAVLIMQHENGCTTTFVNTICTPGNRDGSIEIATSGGYFFEIFECIHLRVRKGEEIIYESPVEDYHIGDGYTTRHFINEVLLRKKTPYISENDGYAALKIALAARESSKKGKWVEL